MMKDAVSDYRCLGRTLPAFGTLAGSRLKSPGFRLFTRGHIVT